MSNANTTTALTKWDAESEAKVRELITSGRSVPKALVQLSPKGFVAGLRKERRGAIYLNSDRYLGEMRQDGYRLCDIKAPVERANGDKVVTVKFLKQTDPVVRVSKELGLTGKAIEALRALVSQAQEKQVAAAA